MRDPDVILKEMQELFESHEARKDPYGAEKFRELFLEHLKSIGYVMEKTECGLCGYAFDVQGLEERWETRYEDGVFTVVYTCPHDNAQTPLRFQRPKGVPFIN